MEALERSMIEWGVAALTLPGQSESGDRYVVELFPQGALVGVVDGLGHGEEAAAAAKAATDTLKLHAGDSIISLARHCHEALRGTRGAVMSLASFNASDGTMTWLGVGNVEGVLLHGDAYSASESLSLRGGVVGHQLPRLFASVVSLNLGDTLIFATDGVRSGFEEGLRAGPPQPIADRILATCARGSDDALVVVVRYVNSYDEGR